MRKRIILSALLLTVFAAVLISTGLKAETTTIPTTTLSGSETTETNTNDYIYVDEEDLINQIYQTIYDDIYAELLETFKASINQAVYDEIYAAIEAKIDLLLSQETLELSADAMQKSIFEVAELASHSVIGVSSYLDDTGIALGSAVIFDYDPATEIYYLITNEHVVNGGNNYKVVLSDMTKIEATLHGVDEEVDIAILSFDATGLDYAFELSVLGDSDLLSKGSVVIAAGNPKGYDFYGSITMGIVAATDRNNGDDFFVGYIQHDAAINSGNSGGPLYNLAGEVVGINVSKYATTEIEGMGFAIPINRVKEVIVNILSGSIVDSTLKPRMGGSFQDISTTVNNGTVVVSGLVLGDTISIEPLTLTLPTGIDQGLIVKVLTNSLAMKNAGMQIGDLIVQIDGYQITTLYQFYLHLNEFYRAGDTLTVSYYRLDSTTLVYSSTLTTVQLTLI